MKLKDVYDVNLYNVFVNEKKRYEGVFTVSYNNKKQQLKYALEGKGAITVRYSRDRGNANREDFYYSSENEPDKLEHMAILCDNGMTGRFVDDKFFDLPKQFRTIINYYRNPQERRIMGIEQAQAAAKHHKKLTFGRD